MSVRRAFAPALLVVSFGTGCDHRPETPPLFAISVSVESDPGVPLAGASLLRDGNTVGTSGPDGHATLALSGAEGDTVSIALRCPADYAAANAALSIPLHKLAEGARPPSYELRCAPETRTVVVVVRASNGADLPVLYLGKELARTDDSGAAHVNLQLRPGERFELSLSTDAKPSLSPKNPSAVFVAPDHDDLLFFDQRFDAPRVPRAVRRGPTAF